MTKTSSSFIVLVGLPCCFMLFLLLFIFFMEPCCLGPPGSPPRLEGGVAAQRCHMGGWRCLLTDTPSFDQPFRVHCLKKKIKLVSVVSIWMIQRLFSFKQMKLSTVHWVQWCNGQTKKKLSRKEGLSFFNFEDVSVSAERGEVILPLVKLQGVLLSVS